ncbi:glycosyl hydrolase family 17, partial [bacterium]|nr:glycosyl hydrolase family 17 [bacterium]
MGHPTKESIMTGRTQRSVLLLVQLTFLVAVLAGCSSDPRTARDVDSSVPSEGLTLLGNDDIQAISYSGHRLVPRSVENTPSVAETKEDLRIMAAMDIQLLRTYNTTIFPHSERILQAIRELKQEDPDFEMFVMLGAWMQCVGAFTDAADHAVEDAAFNQREIERAIELAAEYDDIVKIIAVGNESMVTWQGHFVPAATILRWVTYLQDARDRGDIPAGTMITTSENWAALGGEESYRNEDLAELVSRMDFLSVHTYAFHDTYYNPAMQWAPLPDETDVPVTEQIDRGIARAIELQEDQVQAVRDYLTSLGLDREIHIGETGWASMDDSHYGPDGTHAADEYIAGLFHAAAREWTRENGMTCFYFQAFDEPWKSDGTAGSEGHFGLITVDGRVKYALWDLVDAGVFEG